MDLLKFALQCHGSFGPGPNHFKKYRPFVLRLGCFCPFHRLLGELAILGGKMHVQSVRVIGDDSERKMGQLRASEKRFVCRFHTAFWTPFGDEFELTGEKQPALVNNVPLGDVDAVTRSLKSSPVTHI